MSKKREEIERNNFNSFLASKGIIIPSFENYGRANGLYDFGPIGSRIYSRLKDIIRKKMTRKFGFKELITNSLTPPEVLENSLHIKNFVNTVYKCKDCGILSKEEGKCQKFNNR